MIWHPAMALAWLVATIYFIATVGFTTMRIAADPVGTLDVGTPGFRDL